MYKVLEIVRDNETSEIIKAVLIYEVEGKIKKHISTDDETIKDIIAKFRAQENMTYSELVQFGYINVKYIDKMNDEDRFDRIDHTKQNYGPNGIYQRHPRSEKHQIESVDKWENMRNYPVMDAGSFLLKVKSKKIRVKAILLAIIIAGSSLALVKSVSNRNKYNTHVHTINFNYHGLYWNYGGFERTLVNLIEGNYSEVNTNQYNEFIEQLEEMYQSNFANWRGEDIEGRNKFSGVYYDLSLYYEDGTKEKESLHYFEQKYNYIVQKHANRLENMDDKTALAFSRMFCDELYGFIFRNNNLGDNYIKFDNLSPTAQLIIMEMFKNSVESIDYADVTDVSLGKGRIGYSTITNEQVLEQVKNKKNNIIKELETEIVRSSKKR